jgi:ABC-type nitrate/sulfonate/bicarbonate transport system substrate-binding protein
MRDVHLLSRRDIVKTAGLAGVSFVVSGASIAGAEPKKLQQMSIFVGATPHFGNVIIGNERGFFEKEGLPTQITHFASGSTAVNAFRAGRGNVVVAGDMPSLRLWQQGGIGICPQANYGDLSVIVAKKSMNKPQDFKGKKVGVLVGSTSEYFTKLYLASGNVSYSDIDVINLTPAGMVTGLARGDIDAFVIWQPFGWRAVEADKDAHIVTTAAPYFHEWEMCSTTPEYAKDHDAEIVAFLKGLDASGKWIAENTDEASKIIAKSLRMDDSSLAKRMIEKISWNIAYTKRFRSDMDRLSHFVKIKLDWNKMFEPKYLKQLGPSYVET